MLHVNHYADYEYSDYNYKTCCGSRGEIGYGHLIVNLRTKRRLGSVVLNSVYAYVVRKL